MATMEYMVPFFSDASIELKLVLFFVFTGLHTNERAVHQESENDYESTQVSSM